MNALEAWLLKPYKVHIISQMSILNCCNRPKQTQSVHIIHTKCTFHENPPTHCIAGTAHRIWEICERKSRECFYMIPFSSFRDERERNKKYLSQQQLVLYFATVRRRGYGTCLLVHIIVTFFKQSNPNINPLCSLSKEQLFVTSLYEKMWKNNDHKNLC